VCERSQVRFSLGAKFQKIALAAGRKVSKNCFGWSLGSSCHMTGRWVPPLIKKNILKFFSYFFLEFFGSAFAECRTLDKAFAECPIKDTWQRPLYQ
jgi:hypothetical protein